MQSINNRGALFASSVLILSLISCTSEKPGTPSSSQPWGIIEPVIKQASGSEIKYEDVNKSQGVTYSVDDTLVFSGNTTGITLKVQNVCSRGEEQITYSRQMPARGTIKLIELMPYEILYSRDALHLYGVTCSLDVTATKANGSIHYLRGAHLTMNESSQNELELFVRMKKIDIIDGQLPRIPLAQFDDVLLPRLSEHDEISMQCETFKADSAGRAVRSLADLEHDVDFATLSRSEVCRLFRFDEQQNVVALSPFFVLEFLDMTGMITNHYIPVVPPDAFSHGYRMDKPVSLSSQTIRNGFSHPLILRIPKMVPAVLKIRLETPTETDYPNPLQTRIEGYVKVATHENDWIVQLLPGQQIRVHLETVPSIRCNWTILDIQATLSQPLYFQVVGEDLRETLVSWQGAPLSTDKARSNYSHLAVPSIDQVYANDPNLCRPGP